MEKQGKVCSKCGEWKLLEEYNKRKASKDGRRPICKECQKEQNKQWRESNKEHIKQWRENNKEKKKEIDKQWRRNNKERIKEYNKKLKETQYYKKYFENNKERVRQYRENNKEKIKEHDKQRYKSSKENNLQYISTIAEQINSIFKQLNLPVYGYIYKFENIKTGRVYIGETILTLKERYKSNVIQGWIKERLKYDTQKFKEELIETDIKVTEILDIAFCRYHLNKLEAYYISKYDSYNNGYNNYAGNHNTTDGLKEFNEILAEHNLKFVDGKLVKIA